MYPCLVLAGWGDVIDKIGQQEEECTEEVGEISFITCLIGGYLVKQAGGRKGEKGTEENDPELISFSPVF